METTKKHIKTILNTQPSVIFFFKFEDLRKPTLRVADILIAFVWVLVAPWSGDMACC